jgi:hypothetical protein
MPAAVGSGAFGCAQESKMIREKQTNGVSEAYGEREAGNAGKDNAYEFFPHR